MSKGVTRLGYHYYRGGVREVSYTALGHFIHTLLYHYNMKKISETPSLPRVSTVNLDNIAISTIPTHRFPHKGRYAFLGELGGIWDRFRKPIEKTTIYQSLHDRFENGYRWEETRLYQAKRWKLDRRNSGIVKQLDQQFAAIDDLYEDIKSNGYSSSSVPLHRVNKLEPTPQIADGVLVGEYIVPDEPRVGIGHDGTYIRLGGGRHRLAIARLLDLQEIPVVVLVQHPRYDSVG